MMHVRKLRTAIGLALAGALAFAAYPSISSAQMGSTHIDLFNVEGRFERDIDVGRPGFGTAGDYAVESQPLLDPDGGSRLGRSITELTIVRPVSRGQDFEIVVDSTLRLADGALVLDGGLRYSELLGGGTIPVVGGTGAFAGARGIAVFTAGTVAGEDGFLLSIDITTG